MTYSYKTIEKSAESLFKEKGSKFYGYSYHVDTEEAVQSAVDALRKEHHAARHFCYAYRIGNEGEKYRANDDGEPSHSAGDPILRLLQGRELCYVLVVVVRYFGGTKLGVGGLIQAYGEAARMALDLSGCCEVECTQSVKVEFAYAQMSEVMRVLKKYELDMDTHDFNITCRLVCSVPLRLSVDFFSDMESIPFIKVSA